jgi:hypothetical protein
MTKASHWVNTLWMSLDWRLTMSVFFFISAVVARDVNKDLVD